MRTQEILTRVYEAIALSGDNKLSPVCVALTSLASDLEAQLRREIANSKGVSSALKTVTAILKENEKCRRSLAYPWIDSEGRQCVCNGFVAFRLRNHLPLPERPKDVGDGIDLDRVFPTSLTGYKRLPMPSAKEIREFIAVERAKFTGRRNNFTPEWDFGPHEPSVNANYLLYAATIFPNAAELFWNTLTTALVITCKEGDGVVLPIRKQGKTQAPPATEEERKAVEEEQQRRENIRKAPADHKAAQEEANEAQRAKNAALIEAEQATDEAAKAKAMESYYAFSEAEGQARLRAYSAAQIYDPDFDISPEQFEYLVKLLHVREYNAA